MSSVSPSMAAAFELYRPYWQLMKDGPATEALERVIAFAENAPDEDHLAALAVALFEPLVDIHHEEIHDVLEAALKRSDNLREVLRGSILHVPDEVERSLRRDAEG